MNKTGKFSVGWLAASQIKARKWISVLGATLVSTMVCQGQGGGGGGGFQIIPGNNPNAGPALTITGTVFDASGAPAPGVMVVLAPPYLGLNRQITSDAIGNYTLNWQPRPVNANAAQPITYSLVARDMDHNAAASHAIDETTTKLDLHLQPALTIATKVQDADGKPITNATGTLNMRSGNIGFPITRPPSRTDDQGRLVFTALPQGYAYVLRVTTSGYGASRPQTIAEADTHTARIDLPAIVLQAANMKLAGQVLGTDGQPVAGARVNVLGVGQPSTNTDSDETGHFSFLVCDGAITVIANAQGASGNTRSVGGDTNVVVRLGSNNNGPIAATVAANPLPPVNSHTITGTMFDPSGAPDPGVAMSVTPGGGGRQDVKSDASGKFSVPWQTIQVGGANPVVIQYLLVARDSEHNFAAAVAIDEKTTSMDVHLQGGLTLSGAVVDNNDVPVKTAMVSIIMLTPPASTQLLRQPVAVDEQGVFTFKGLPQGWSYNLNVNSSGYGGAMAQARSNETQTASLRLPNIRLKTADQRLEGQVLGPDGNPVAGARVNVVGQGQPRTNTLSDASGHFAFMVCEGNVRIAANIQSAAQGNGNGGLQILTGNTQAQGGDLNVVVRLAARQTVQTVAGVAQAQARFGPLREPSWSWGAISKWPQEHKVVVLGLLTAQLAVMVVTAGIILWMTRIRARGL